MQLRLKRVYDTPAPNDGFRVLVDRLWPRGMTKERAALDLWAKDVAPSNELRTAFIHGGEDWEAFALDYRAELATNPAVGELRAVLGAHPVVTLLHSARDPEHNHAVLLRDALEGA